MVTKIDLGTFFRNKRAILEQVILILKADGEGFSSMFPGLNDNRVVVHQSPDHSEWRARHWTVDQSFIDYRVVSDSRFSGCLALEEIDRNF